MEAIISKFDIQAYRELADTISDIDTLEPFIIEAQNIELRECLGDALFYAVVENQDDGIYKILIEGEDYEYQNNTIYFDGLKPMLCYIAYARMIAQHGIKVTRYGLVKKTTQESEHADDGSISRLLTKARTTAKFYQKQANQYLDTKRTTYTLWGASTTVGLSGSTRITQITNY